MMEVYGDKDTEKDLLKITDGLPYIKCVYDIKNHNETQIINYRGEKRINEEIESKIQILNGNKKEKIKFTKKFDKI